MAAKDILLRAGITFSANDIDTKAIKDAVTKAVSTTALNINKAKFGTPAKTALREAFQRISFRVDKAAFGRSGQTSLRQKFREIIFSIGAATFSATALKQLNAQLGLNQFKLNQVQQKQQQQRGGASQRGGKQQAAATTSTRTFNEAIKEQGLLFNRSLQDLQAYNTVVGKTDKQQLNFQKTIAQGGQSLQGFGANIVKITTRFTAYLASLRAIFAVQQAFSKSLEVIFKFDATLQDLNKVIDATPQGLAEVSKGLFEVAATTGQSVFAVAESFGVFRRAIDDNEEALKRTEAALIAVNISELTVAESTRFVTSSMNIFGNELNDEIEALDILSITADNAATTAAQLGRGVLRSGAAAEAVGVTFRELNAIIAATEEATKLGGSQIGSALKTIFARLAANSDELRRNANALGANLRASDSVFQSLEKLNQIFPSLNREQKAQLTQIVAGKRRFTEFNAIITSFNKTQELLIKQAGASGTALRKNEEEIETLQVSTQKLKNEFALLVTSLSGADQGADAVGTVRESIAGVVDIVTLGVKVVNDLLKNLGGLENLGAALTGTFIGLVKVGLFRIGPAVLASLVSGAKAFLGVGQKITTVLSASTGAINAQAGAQQGVVSNQTKILTQLEREKQIREEIARINKQFTGSGFPTGPKGGAGRFGLAQERAGPGQAGILAKINQTITKGRKTISTGIRGFRQTLKGADASFGRLSKNAIATALAFSTAATASRAFADDLEKSGSQFSADLLRSGASAAELGVTFGLLLGPTKGLAIGIVVALKGVTEALADISARAQVTLESQEFLARSTTTLGQALAIGGEDGRKAFEAAGTATNEFGEEVANNARFLGELSQQFDQSTDSVSKFINKAADNFDNLSRAIEANARALKFGRELSKLTEGIERKILTLEAQADTGKLTGAFKGLGDITAQLNVQLDKFDLKVASTNERVDKQNKLLEIGEQLLNADNRATLDILDTNLLTTDEIRKQRTLLSQAKSEATASAFEFEKIDATNKSILETQNFRLKNLQEGLKLEKATSNEAGRIKELEAEIATLTQSIAERRTAGAKAAKLNTDAQSNVARITKALNGLVDETVEKVTNIVKLTEQQKSAAELLNAESTVLIKNLDDETALLEQSLRVRTEIARQQIAGGTLAQRQEAELANIRERSQEKIREFQAQQARNIEALNRQAKNASTEQERAAINAAIAVAGAAQPEELAAFERKVAVDVELKLIDVNKKQIEQAEGALQQFRLNNIQKLLDSEIQFANKRIELIRELQETQAGRAFLREELSPQPGLERQLGFFNAAIVESLTNAADASTTAILKEFDELRVGGVFTLEDLAKASEEFFQAEEALANLRKSGAGTTEIAQAEADFDRIRKQLELVANSGADAFERLEFIQSATAQIIQQEEERTSEIRQIALERAKEAAQEVADAEKKLLEERNKIPALNARIIQANKQLSQAQDRIGDATNALLQANQDLADEQFKLAFNLGLAEVRARATAGSLSTASEQIDALAGAFRKAASEAVASSQTILEARRQLLQAELSLVQNQLQTIQGLALEAATADPNQLAQLQQSAQAAAAISAGEAQVGDFPPEIIQGLSKFTDLFPGLERSILEFGAQRLGIDPSVFQSFEDRLVELNTGIAETGQSQVDAAQANVRAAQAQLEETRQQRDIAQQVLDVAISQRDAAFQNVAQAGANLNVTRIGFSQIAQQTAKTLSEFKAGRIASEEAKKALDLLAKEEANLLKQVEDQKLTAQEALGITKEQAVSINEAKVEQTATKDKVAEGVQKQEETNALLTFLKNIGEDTLSAIQQGQGLAGAFATGIQGGLLNVAGGTLHANEIAGLMNAATREKRAMPTGSRLMLANTSETVIPRKAVKRFRRAADGHIPNAQGGNSNGKIESAVSQLATETNDLRRSISELAQNVSAQGPIQINVDSNRTIKVDGLSELPQAIESAIAQRLGDTPSQAEVTAVRQSVTDVLNRLRENGLEDFNSLGV